MRTILITGASGGIAQALVTLLPEDKLILVGRNGQKLANLYESHPHKYIVELDVTDETAVTAFVEEFYAQGGTIDVLINNAGYGFYKDFETFSGEEVADMFAVNTFALMTFCRAVGAHMKAARAGHIINIISMSGHIATAQSSVYSASKFAAMGFSNTIRLELAKYQVAVTTVNPGPVATGFFDLADPDGSYQKKVQAFLIQPDVVAKAIIKAMKTHRREINLPWTLALSQKIYALFPAVADWLSLHVFNFK